MFQNPTSPSFPECRAPAWVSSLGILLALPEAHRILPSAWLRTERAVGNDPYIWIALCCLRCIFILRLIVTENKLVIARVVGLED